MCKHFTVPYVIVTHTHTLVGVLGIKVKIMLPHDPTGKSGPKKALPDQVSIPPYPLFVTLTLKCFIQVSVVEPKDDVRVTEPYSEQKAGKPTAAPTVPVFDQQTPAPIPSV